ncbi:MAG: L,D-transpeptidase, partial [Ilumatobacteraceae bacterium]
PDGNYTVSFTTPSGSVDEQTALALTNASARVESLTVDPGVVVEIDKTRQVLFVVVDGRVEWALNISTGSGQYYLEQNQKDPTKWESGRSLTPSGRFTVQRERPEGWWKGDLGEIYRPKYFKGGIALHGSPSIPNYPASHGCVRVSTPAMDMIWSTGLVPIGTPVWVYGEDVPPMGDPPQPPAPLPPSTEAPLLTIPPINFTF